MKAVKTYRSFIALLLTGVFVTQLFSNWLMVVDYYTNTSAYARNCINKSRPKLHCNGQCQLMKKIEAAEKKQQDATEKKFAENEITLFASSINNALPEPAANSIPAVKIPILPLYHASMHVTDLFRPPQC